MVGRLVVVDDELVVGGRLVVDDDVLVVGGRLVVVDALVDVDGVDVVGAVVTLPGDGIVDNKT